jgi:type VI protein secretion system component VasF
MSDELTQHTLNVIDYGLRLKDRLAAGDNLLIDSEIARLKQMLWGEGSVRGHPDYGDNLPRPILPDSREFLGVRYALTCWLDEIFISDPDCIWSDQWKEKALEPEIYGGAQERAWRFWVQAELAEKRPGAEALESYLWCVMLGFRGDPRLVNPADWAERVRRRVLTSRQQEVRLPADLGMKPNVPLLRGRDRFRIATRGLVVVAAIGLFVTTAALASLFSSR